MDKLQPLIKHRYWICFGFATIFAIVGWFMASGALAEAIDARSKLVQGSFDEAKQGASNPNQKWVEEAKKKNEIDALAYKNAATSLRERQKNARQWPALIQEEMQGIAYQDQIKNQLTREKWAANYADEIEGLLEIVKPYRKGEGLVVVDSNRITHKPYNSWLTRAPTSPEIWDAQEDIWLLRSLLTSIASVNGEADRIGESAVREIYRLTLRGGDRNATPAAAGGGGDMGGMGAMGGLEGAAGMMGGGLAGGAGGAGAGASYPGKEFEGSAGSDILAEEFGADASAGAAGGGMGFGKGSMGSMGSMMGAMSGMSEMSTMGAAPGGAEGGAAPAEEKRYVDAIEDSYKTRGFLLDVRVRDDKLPELLAALTDSDFPVEIVRVEVTTQGGAAAAGMTGGMGGMGGGDDLAGGMGMAPGGLSGMGGAPGGGMGGGMMPPPPPGGAGGLSSGMGSMPGKLGGLGAGGEMGDPSMGGLSGYGGMDGGMSGTGGDALQNALSDPLLVTVKIGGLMTLYQSAQESNAEAATEAAGATEQSTAAPPTVTPEPATTGGEPTATEGTTPAAADAAAATAADASAPAPTDSAAPATPETPATVDGAAQPATTETPSATEGTATPPADGNPAGSETPAPATTPAGDVTTPPATPAAPGTNPPPQ